MLVAGYIVIYALFQSNQEKTAIINSQAKEYFKLINRGKEGVIVLSSFETLHAKGHPFEARVKFRNQAAIQIFTGAPPEQMMEESLITIKEREEQFLDSHHFKKAIFKPVNLSMKEDAVISNGLSEGQGSSSRTLTQIVLEKMGNEQCLDTTAKPLTSASIGYPD